MGSLQPHSNDPNIWNWDNIWRANIPLKVRNFVWRLGRDVLPHRVNLQKCGINTSCLCALCGVNPENNWHLFIDCPVTIKVWKDANLWNLINARAELSDDFTTFLFSTLDVVPVTVRNKLLMVLWSIWNHRNDAWLNDAVKATTRVTRQASNVLCDWLATNELRLQQGLNVRPDRCDLWHSPPAGFFKCNIDAAIFGDTHQSGFGAVFRDDHGASVAARSTITCGTPLVKECEAMALANAIKWVLDLGLQRVIFESDAKLVVDAFTSTIDDLSEFGASISRCCSLLNQGDSFSVRFIRRQANGAAHVLARMARSLPSQATFSYLPSFMIDHVTSICNLNH